jgi:uncharacterized GH25 family protein
MNRKIIASAVLLAIAFLSQARQFWLQPQKFFYTVGEAALVSIRVGENFMGEPSGLKKDQIEKLDLHHVSKTSDMKLQVKEGDKDNVSIVLNEAGTYLLAMQSKNTFSELPAEAFNTYLKDDGLDEAIAQREKINSSGKVGKEFYTLYAKLLLQAGDKKDDTYKKVIGFPIEIVPQSNPYTLKKGDAIRFTILWEGKPWFGAKVRVWNRGDNRTTIQNIYTEKDGTISMPISNSGSWMISVVKMVAAKHKEADWQSYRGSLVFGVQ